jgi:DNA invertase Pin-like site-specific DNA recombinase
LCREASCLLTSKCERGKVKQGERRAVIGYVRVSTDEQSRDGVSLDAQRDKVRLYAELHGLDLVEIECDAGVSAKTLDRPALARVLAMLDAGALDGLVVYKLDRLTRSLADWSLLIDRYFGEKAGKALMSVSESIDTRTAGGRMVLNIMMTVAQWERETICERTQTALDHKRSRGERISGRLPYGQDLAADGKQLVPNRREQDVLAEIRSLRAQGLSLRKVCAALNDRGEPTKTGASWSPSTVRALAARHD